MPSSDDFSTDASTNGRPADDAFFTATTNSDNHYDRVYKVKLPPEAKDALGAVIADPDFPKIRSYQDTIRDAWAHRIPVYRDMADNPDTIAAMQRFYDWMTLDNNLADQIDRMNSRSRMVDNASLAMQAPDPTGRVVQMVTQLIDLTYDLHDKARLRLELELYKQRYQ